MRRRSEKAATKKAKASPEKKEKEKPDRLKRTRTRRRKQSSSSENESVEESVSKPTTAEVSVPIPETTQVVAKEESPELSQEQVWQVKAADTSSDGGEIQKLKICLTRPPSTPERVDRSPRSKRKHSRATSSSDTPSGDSEEKKKPKHRTRKTTAEAKDSPEKNSMAQSDEMETENQAQPSTKMDSDISQSNESKDSKETSAYDTPMSTTNDDVKDDKKEVTDKNEGKPTNDIQDVQDKTSDADTTVSSPKHDDVNTSPEKKQSPVRKRSSSVEKSEVLELHAEDMRCESSDFKESKEEDSKDRSINQADVEIEGDATKVSINEAENEVSGNAESTAEVKTSDTKNDVVEISQEETKKESTDTQETSSEVKQVDNKQQISTDCHEESGDVKNTPDMESSTKDTGENSKDDSKKDIEVAKPADDISNGQTTSIIINRKRRWGSRPSKLTTQKSITISTDVLKDIIPDVKPAEFDEVIEERKHKRIEIPERMDRPVLPKIVIDNTVNVERNKKESDDKDVENIEEKKSKDTYALASSRKISIVRDSESIIARPPSPPRHKQSHILYITNLVRPFTLPQLKNLLQRTGRITQNGFWIDKIKSKCFVIYENEDQAVETRHALHGVTWPVSNPKTLQVDFSTQEDFDKAKANEDTDNAQASTIPGTVEDWLREQDMKREKGEIVNDRPWERKTTMREWDVGKNDKSKEKDKFQREERPLEKRRNRSPERSPEPARKFKKKEEEAPAKLLDDLFRKTKTTPCIYWLPLSAETIAVKEEQRRKHMAEYERRMQENRRPHRRH